mmetsp:Transcript_22729/g.35000  ORF Transcript_22729/g.35000 Transcript_22729/m.35000 type:complete len:381 (+) Transcript_22729:195-1337(+)
MLMKMSPNMSTTLSSDHHHLSSTCESETSNSHDGFPSSLSSMTNEKKQVLDFVSHMHKLNVMEAKALYIVAEMKSIEFAGFSEVFNDVAKELVTIDELYWKAADGDAIDLTKESEDEEDDDGLMYVTKALISSLEKRANCMDCNSSVLLASSDENNEALGFCFQAFSERFRATAAQLESYPPESIADLVGFIKDDLKKRYQHLKALRKRHTESSMVVALFLKKFRESLEELVQVTRSFARRKFGLSASVHVKSWDVPPPSKKEENPLEPPEDRIASDQSAFSVDPTVTTHSSATSESGTCRGSGFSAVSNSQWAEGLLSLDQIASDPVEQPALTASKKSQGITKQDSLARRLDDVLSRSSHGCLVCAFTSGDKKKCICKT